MTCLTHRTVCFGVEEPYMSSFLWAPCLTLIVPGTVLNTPKTLAKYKLNRKELVILQLVLFFHKKNCFLEFYNLSTMIICMIYSRKFIKFIKYISVAWSSSCWLCFNQKFNLVVAKVVWGGGAGSGCSESSARCLTPFYWYSQSRGQKAELILTMSQWVSAWKAFVKCMENIWENESQQPSINTVSASGLIVLMTGRRQLPCLPSWYPGIPAL